MRIVKFLVEDLRDKVFSEYKLQPRNSCGANPDAEIFLVHNQGIYCMADCKHELSNRDSSIVYALGCNPDIDEMWLQTSREIAGGNDFCQAIPATWIEAAIINESKYLEIKITDNEITLNK